MGLRRRLSYIQTDKVSSKLLVSISSNSKGIHLALWARSCQTAAENWGVGVCVTSALSSTSTPYIADTFKNMNSYFTSLPLEEVTAHQSHHSLRPVCAQDTQHIFHCHRDKLAMRAQRKGTRTARA